MLGLPADAPELGVGEEVEGIKYIKHDFKLLTNLFASFSQDFICKHAPKQ